MSAKGVKRPAIKSVKIPPTKGVAKVTQPQLQPQPQPDPHLDDIFVIRGGKVNGVKEGFKMSLFCKHVTECKCYNIFDKNGLLVAMYNMDSGFYMRV
jgi:hypothetical protein